MKELKLYLEMAKRKGYTLDTGELALRFGVSTKQVRQVINEVYYPVTLKVLIFK